MDERRSIEIAVGAESAVLLPERCVWLPARQTLLVADVHVGKSETLREAGIPVPLGDLADDLERLTALVRMYSARRLLVLGDWIHHARGMSVGVQHAVRDWRRSVDAEVVVVKGNHDRDVDALLDAWGIDNAGDELVEGGFRFVHEPSMHPDFFSWAGPYAPGRQHRAKTSKDAGTGVRCRRPAWGSPALWKIHGGGAVPAAGG